MWILSIFLVLGIVSAAYIALYGYSEFERMQQCIPNPSNPNPSNCTAAEQRHHELPLLVNILLVAGGLGGGIGFVLLFVFIIGVVIPDFILKPLTWVLRILPRWAKVLNLLLIVIAFHFNLLAS